MLVVYEDSSSRICGGSRGSDHCACLTGSDVTRSDVNQMTGSDITGSHVIFSHAFPPYFFPYFVPVLLIPKKIHIFFSCTFFPRIVFPYYFPILFQMSRRLKSNVLKSQSVVFLEYVVIAQAMLLAEYSFKRHP